MAPLPFDVPGLDNDLNEKIDFHVQRALAEEDAMVCAFGERWGPEPDSRDKYFGFKPGNGIHDITKLRCALGVGLVVEGHRPKRKDGLAGDNRPGFGRVDALGTPSS